MINGTSMIIEFIGFRNTAEPNEIFFSDNFKELPKVVSTMMVGIIPKSVAPINLVKEIFSMLLIIVMAHEGKIGIILQINKYKKVFSLSIICSFNHF